MIEFIRRIGFDPASPLLKKENIYLALFGIVSWLKAANVLPVEADVEATTLGVLQLVLGVIAGVNFFISLLSKGKAPLVKAFAAGAMLAALAAPAVASERVSAGLSAGPAIISRDSGSSFGFIPAAWAGYSVSDRVTATSTLDAEYADGSSPAYLGTLGGRLNVERSAKYRLALGIDYVHGFGPAQTGDTWRALMVGSAILRRGSDGRPSWSADLRPTLDFETGKSTWRLAAKWHGL